jgi:GTP-binding protein YchF
LDSLERRFDQATKKAKGNDREAKEQLVVMEPLIAALRDGKPARTVEFSKEQQVTVKRLQLLTDKPIMYICNVGEEDAATGNAFSAEVEEWAKSQGATAVTIAAAIEAEVASLETEEEQSEFLESLGLSEPGLVRVIRSGYALLGLLTFFTCGPKEARAWTVHDGATAPEAAGEIHTDFQRGFIAAETIAFDDYIACEGEQRAKESGKMRQEGRDYRVKDGDVLLFRFNV